MMGWNGWGHMTGWGWAATTLASLLFLALLGLVAWVVVRAVRRPGDGPSRAPRTAGPDTAERLLADRFARGEIDEDEYRRRLATLRSVGTVPGTW
ncbi:putative membrane protein [Geodermatophilus siccatus]|uniref:Putative membrane protein n=1 Tax=Geodermatophilus siccatus TaxID=1137991 RepID=A0A1G9NQE5_9ACTN|nr:SHOCT domain-containing protein [Geodermatophilus siccatus]SDL88257.1 putative membrane protein [Geodermatophilus siccatus]